MEGEKRASQCNHRLCECKGHRSRIHQQLRAAGRTDEPPAAPLLHQLLPDRQAFSALTSQTSHLLSLHDSFFSFFNFPVRAPRLPPEAGGRGGSKFVRCGGHLLSASPAGNTIPARPRKNPEAPAQPASLVSAQSRHLSILATNGAAKLPPIRHRHCRRWKKSNTKGRGGDCCWLMEIFSFFLFRGKAERQTRGHETSQ